MKTGRNSFTTTQLSCYFCLDGLGQTFKPARHSNRRVVFNKEGESADQDDHKKFRRTMQCLRGSIDPVLALEADSDQILKWWVDALHAVHPDMKSHTGGTLSMGKGSTHSASKSQRLNRKSSTKAEVVGVDDTMAQVLWTCYFLEAQGCKVEKNTVHQDNQSAVLLERNGHGSSSKRTRHINVRCFFVSDRIKSGEMNVECCPTGVMVADFFTKPLQGAKFTKFRDLIMNVWQVDPCGPMESGSKECVEMS
jgi:hypothetical protein